jgi:hypothetical protein
MKSFHQKGLMAASSLAMLFALGACDKLDNRTATGADSTKSSSRAAKEETQDAKARANAKNDSTKAMGSSPTEKKTP